MKYQASVTSIVKLSSMKPGRHFLVQLMWIWWIQNGELNIACLLFTIIYIIIPVTDDDDDVRIHE